MTEMGITDGTEGMCHSVGGYFVHLSQFLLIYPAS
jgi:hypothetical protein